ncbi:MAG: proteasome activator [Actinomycetota bacterium]
MKWKRAEPEPTETVAPTPEAVDEIPPEPTDRLEGDSAKLLRIAVMAHELLDEVRHMPLDEGGRRRLRAIHEMTVGELKKLLPEDLRHEFEAMTLPLEESASESEVRLAQVQLVGWLEGLMHGIQAALWARVVSALTQARQLPRTRPEKVEEQEPGQYL